MDVVKFGVLGGTFDPIHNGHLALAKAVKDALNLETVIFVPAGKPPHKMKKTLATAKHRVRMLELALVDFADFTISNVDIDRLPPHYSVEMLPLVQAEYGIAPAQTYFIIGADLLPKFPRWYQPQRLLKLCQPAVVHRPGYAFNLQEIYARLPILESKIHWVEMPPIPVSSTKIRDAIQQCQPIDNFVPPAVEAYIRQENLYR